MDTTLNFSEKKKNFWISTTGYRTLFVLRLLLQEARSIRELIKFLKDEGVVKKSVSIDTIRAAINTLRKIGCNIPRPSRGNNYKYEIVSHPFVSQLSLEEINSLFKLRDTLCENYDWEKILLVNNLFNKLISFTTVENLTDEIDDSGILLNIDRKILTQLSSPNLLNRKIKIEYTSVEYDLEILEIIPKKITYRNGKLYLECYNFKYSQNSILNIERIEKIVHVDFNEIYDDIDVYDVVYKVNNDSVKNFELNDNEEIIEKTKKSITIKAKVINEFIFIQRLLLLGTDFDIISPSFFKEKLIDKLKLIKRRYEDA